MEAKQKEETPEEIIQRLEVDLSPSPVKYQGLSKEVLLVLIKNLQALDRLEKEIYQRSLELKNPKEPNQMQPGEAELWKEYASRYVELSSPMCLKPVDQGSRSFGEPSKYDYLSYPDTKLVFLMKSLKRAVVEVHYEYGAESKEQFVLKKDGDDWKIEGKKYGFPGEEKWYKDEL